MATPPPYKRQKREEYRRQLTNATTDDAASVKAPQKRFFRQRAHANPFSDHHLD